MFWKKKPKPPIRTTANDQFALETLLLCVATTKDLSSERWAALIDSLEKDPIEISTPLSDRDFAAVLNRAEEYDWGDWDD